MNNLEFRAWDKGGEIMISNRAILKNNSYGLVFNYDNFIPMQWTGLKDKNGVEIYEGDVLRLKFLYGVECEKYVGNYEVSINTYSGIRLDLVKLITPDWTVSNIHIDSSAFRFVDDGQGIIAELEDTYGRSHMARIMWHERHKSMDIEVIGNIYENPELLRK